MRFPLLSLSLAAFLTSCSSVDIETVAREVPEVSVPTSEKNSEPSWVYSPPERDGMVPIVARVESEANYGDDYAMSRVAKLESTRKYQEYIRVQVFSEIESFEAEGQDYSESQMNTLIQTKVNNYGAGGLIEDKKWINPQTGDWVVLYYGKAYYGE